MPKPTGSIHLMDVMNVIYNCCDLNLLPILMEKMFSCQLAIPIKFPNKDKQSSTHLLWSLRGITPEFKTDDGRQNVSSLVEIRLPFVSVIRVERLKQSKSKFLNDFLRSTNHNTFIHRDCRNGELKRKISDGTVEAAWYLPEGKRKGTNEKLSKVFCFLNQRGDATEYLDSTKQLLNVSSITFLMLDIDSLHSRKYERLYDVFKYFGNKTKLVICFITDCVNTNMNQKEEIKTCVQLFKKIGISIARPIFNCHATGVMNASDWMEKFEETLTKCMSETSTELQNNLELFAHSCKKINSNVDEDDPLCRKAFEKSSEILCMINSIEPEEQKSNLLPLQGPLLKKYAQLQKDELREIDPVHSQEEFRAAKQKEQRQVCREQYDLFKNKGNFIKSIYSNLRDAEIHEMKFFSAWTKLMIDHNCQKILASGIPNASFGYENIFREFSQIFQAAKSECDDQTEQSYIFKLPEIMAKLHVDHGLPLELMDGDVAFVHLAWVRAVFREIEKLIGQEKNIFVISVVGTQSSGKSTMLNAMFGLQFRVRAGRCTRGVYCQMIPVDKQSLGVDFDYILVLDTEGLCAKGSQENIRAHDNELATLAIGLGNVTIVNIKGENSSEIEDILQIVTHAMIRIKYLSKVKLNADCVFTHQNVSASNAKQKLKPDQERWLQRLDEATGNWSGC